MVRLLDIKLGLAKLAGVAEKKVEKTVPHINQPSKESAAKSTGGVCGGYFHSSLLKNSGQKVSNRFTAEEIQNIRSRIKLDPVMNRSGNEAVYINTKKFDELFKKDTSYYIAKGGGGAAIGNRYQKFIEHLKTNDPIAPSEVVFFERKGINGPEIRAAFNDGRHRYAVLRDFGMKDVPFAMDKDSIAVARKYGLITG